MERGARTVVGPERPTKWSDPDDARSPRRRPGRFGSGLIRAAVDRTRRAYWGVGRSSTARALRNLDEHERRQSLFRTVFVEAPVAMALLDRELRIVDANDEMARSLGRSARDLRGSQVDVLASSPQPARLALMAQRAALGAGPVLVKHRYQRADGTDGWARTSIRRLQGDDPSVNLVCVIQDVTNDEIALEEQRRDAEHDPLTGLLNRRGGDRRLRAALEKMAGTGPVAVIVCDADRFKEVNDRFGHAAGDELLAGMAGRLRSAVRATDDVARMGGDEFVVVARVSNEQEATAIADRCVRIASGPFRLTTSGQRSEQVTLSAGVAVAYPGGPVEPGSLVAAADRALYAAKAEGGGCWKMAPPR